MNNMKHVKYFLAILTLSVLNHVSANEKNVALSNTEYNSDDYITSNPIETDNEESAFETAKMLISPFTPEEIRQLRNFFDATRQEKSRRPPVIPKVRSISVDLSAGSKIPVLKTVPHEMSTLVFIDSTGAEWTIAAPPRVSDPNAFDVEWLKDTASVIVSAKSYTETANLTVFLKGLSTPVIIKLGHDENKKRTVDYRLDVRVHGRGPNALPQIEGDHKIAIYDETMQNILDGVSVSTAKKIKFTSNTPPTRDIKIWKINDTLYVRTYLKIFSSYKQTLSSADGMNVYSIPLTPYITLSDYNSKIILKLDI